VPDNSPTFLLASADPDLLARIEPTLVAAGARVEPAHSAQAALAAATGESRPDLALLDAALPGMPVAQLLASIRAAESNRRMPIVLIADSIAHDWLDCLNEGALDDLIPRDAAPAYWQFRAHCALRAWRTLYELGNLRDNESRNAQYDRLTGVYNREALLSLLFSETDRVQRMHSPLTLLLFDIDDFGHWNARLGMDACDEMLCQMVRRVEPMLRSYDLLGRTGKDEFLVALPGCSVANAVTLAERLRLEVFSTPYRVSRESIRLSACFGIAHSHGRSPVIVLREAEKALARAKQTGPESIQIFDGPPRPTPAPVTFHLPSSGEELLVW
jgi:two-component system, cell cycle response regulator